MPLSIATNLASMTAQRSFLNSNSDLETAFERLSTGKRINSSVDDAAGLAIGKSLESRVRGLNQAIRNVNDGISMVQISEGTLDEVTTILQRMRDLAVQGANGGLSTTEQGFLDTEHSKLADALGQAIDEAKFNESDLIDDSSATTLTIQSGTDAGDTTSLAIDALTETILDVDAAHIDMTGATAAKFTVAAASGTGAAGQYSVTINGVTYASADNVTATSADDLRSEFIDVTFVSTDGNSTKLSDVFTITENGGTLTFEATSTGDYGTSVTIALVSGGVGSFAAGTSEVVKAGGTGISVIDAALDTVATQRATLGAAQAQLESTVRNLSNVAENTAAAAGRIMDTDYAAETANLTKAQILQQAATSVLAQANAQPQAVLTLLQ
jgi:flagellin